MVLLLDSLPDQLINSKNSLGYASKVIDSPPPKTPLYIFSVPLKSGNMMVSKIYSSFFSQEKKVNTIINKATLIKANYFIKSNEWVYLIVICWLLISSNISLSLNMLNTIKSPVFASFNKPNLVFTDNRLDILLY